MQFQAMAIEVKKAKIEIPYIGIEANNPQCLNTFNNKQYAIV